MTSRWLRLLLALWLLTIGVTPGQNINREMVDLLLLQLQQSKADTHRFSALLALARFHVYKPGEVTLDLDSAITYLKEAQQLSNSLHLLKKKHEAESMLVIAQMEKRDTTLGKTLFTRLVRDCQRTGDKETEADLLARFGASLIFTTKNYPAIFDCYHQAASLYKALNNPEKEIQMLREIASIHTNLGQLAVAEKEFTTVLNRYKAIHYPMLHYTYSWLSYINRLEGNFDKALSYSFLCLESMHKTRDTLLAATFYDNVAQVYLELGNQPQGLIWLKKTLQQWRREKQPEFKMYNAAGSIARILIGQGKTPEALTLLTTLAREIPMSNKVQKGCMAQSLANCYEALHNYSLAEHYYLEAIDWYEKSHQNFEMSQKVQQDVGRFYLERNEFKKAAFYLRNVLAYNPQKTSLSTVKDVYLMLFKVDSAQGDYPSAIRHFQLHKVFNDSIFNEARSRQIARLDIEYETRKNQQNMASLRKQSKLRERELLQTRTIRNGVFIGSILLLLLLGLGYNRYRLKQRSNQLLVAKQLEIDQKNRALQKSLGEQDLLLAEKEWMLKEIHHRVKNNLQIITSLLHSQGAYLNDQTALAAIRESQNRVHAMALIHQKLYQSDHLASVPLAEYIHEIVDYLVDSFDQAGRVDQQLQMVPIELDVTLAVPLGLIINEAVTNSLKYAFPDGGAGVIRIEFQQHETHRYQLTISDNGVGLPADFDPKQSRSLGLGLIRGLSKQIGATLLITGQPGVVIALIFANVNLKRDLS